MNRRAAWHFALLAIVTYFVDVKPILERHCVECHTYGADLDLSSFPFVGGGGDSARITDRMLRRVSSTPVSMPPGNRPKLSSQEIATLRAWRDGGLKP